MKPIPISEGKRIAERYGYDQVIIVARKVSGTTIKGGEHMTTYGTSKVHCEVAAMAGRFLQEKVMGWHKEHAYSAKKGGAS